MELIVEELPGGCTRAALVGRMDIEGALAIDEHLRGPFAARVRTRPTPSTWRD